MPTEQTETIQDDIKAAWEKLSDLERAAVARGLREELFPNEATAAGNIRDALDKVLKADA